MEATVSATSEITLPKPEQKPKLGRIDYCTDLIVNGWVWQQDCKMTVDFSMWDFSKITAISLETGRWKHGRWHTESQPLTPGTDLFNFIAATLRGNEDFETACDEHLRVIPIDGDRIRFLRDVGSL
jgi:hypothetical protein